MQVKTKIILFIVIFFVILAVGFFAGSRFAAFSEISLGLIGAIFAGRAIKRHSDIAGTTDAADRSAFAAGKEAGENARSMDRVVSGSENLQRTGEQLVKSGQRLVDESESLIRETNIGASAANK